MLAFVISLGIDRAVLDSLGHPDSGMRERGAYAFARLYDPGSDRERATLDSLLHDPSEPLHAAALQGLCDRGGPELARVLAVEVPQALLSPGLHLRGVAASCATELPESKARETVETLLDDPKGAGVEEVVALLLLLSRSPDPRLAERVRFAVRWLLGRTLEGAPVTLDGNATLALCALAALGDPVDRLLEDPKAKPDDFVRNDRANAVRAAGGDAVALSALVADANEGVDPALRRQAVDLLFSLPGPMRAKALPALASRLSDPDGGVRLRLLRELTHDPSPASEPLLRKALDEPDPVLRFLPAAGLFDASARGFLSRQGVEELRARKDSDPLVTAALRAALAAWPVPSPSPSPTPSARPAPFRLGVHPPP